MREIDQIKEKIDIVEFIGKYVVLKNAGRNFKGLCPFHREKTPSFFVSGERQSWHCFGACAMGGDVISFFMKAEGLAFYEALKELAKITGVQLSSSFQKSPEDETRDRLTAITHLASEYYHYLLTKHAKGDPARTYLQKRGVSEKIIDSFVLGYAPQGWRNITSYLKNKKFSEEEIVLSGLAIKNGSNVYDRFRGRVMFTIFDHRDNPVGFSGRLLDAHAKEAKYINSPETMLYHKGKTLYGLHQTKNAVRTAKKIILTEGEFDVLTAYSHGIPNVAAIKGTALTEEQLSLVKRFTQDLVLCLDMDIAGDTASRRSIELADSYDLTVRIVQLPVGKDLDEALHKDEPAVKHAIERAIPVYDYIITSAVKRYGLSDIYARSKIASETLPFISKIQNPIIKNHYIRILSHTLEVSEESISDDMEKIARKEKGVMHVEVNTTAQKKTDRTTLLEEHLMALILQSPESESFLQKIEKTRTLEDIQTPVIYKILICLLGKKPIPNELNQAYNRMFLIDIESQLADTNELKKDFNNTVSEIKKLSIRRKLRILATNIQKGGSEGQEANREFNRLTLELKKINNNHDK